MPAVISATSTADKASGKRRTLGFRQDKQHLPVKFSEKEDEFGSISRTI